MPPPIYSTKGARWQQGSFTQGHHSTSSSGSTSCVRLLPQGCLTLPKHHKEFSSPLFPYDQRFFQSMSSLALQHVLMLFPTKLVLSHARQGMDISYTNGTIFLVPIFPLVKVVEDRGIANIERDHVLGMPWSPPKEFKRRHN